MALLIAVWMAYGAGRLLHRAFHELIDARLEDHEIARIRAILDAQTDLRGYHRLRTRRLGNTCQVDLHIEVPRDWDVVRAHELADRIEQLIESELAPAQATIHVDPEAQEPGIEPR
jgi:ferrous-iron efflux pump FieF